MGFDDVSREIKVNMITEIIIISNIKLIRKLA
jgi:hypothetical protein